MGISFVLVGIALVVTGIQNTYQAAGSEIYTDVVGSSTGGQSTNGFIAWLIAIAAVGALGYIPALRTFSTWFMALIVLAIFLSKGKGFFTQFSAALKSGPQLSVPPSNASASSASTSTPSSSWLTDMVNQLGGLSLTLKNPLTGSTYFSTSTQPSAGGQ
jgi:hypothetical protein